MILPKAQSFATYCSLVLDLNVYSFYFSDIHMVETDENAKNEEIEKMLWDLSMKMTNIQQ